MVDITPLLLGELEFNTSLLVGKEKPYGETVNPCVGFVLPNPPEDESEGED